MSAAHAKQSLLEHAIEYAEAGFLVFPAAGITKPAPLNVINDWRSGKISKKEAAASARCTCGVKGCASPGKHPLVSQTKATRDPKKLREWFDDDWGQNIGLVLPDGWIALDFDTYEPGVEAKLASVRMVLRGQQTWEQTSGAGGTHLVFQGAPDGLGTMLDSESGVDLIHKDSRYIIAEPSQHWTGQRYAFKVATEAPAQLPAMLVERVKQGAKRTRPLPARSNPQAETKLVMPLDFVGTAYDWAIELASERLPPAVSAGDDGDGTGVEPGHSTLQRAGLYLIAGCGLDEDDALELLWEEYNPRCVPPWDENERDDFERCVLGSGGHIPPEEVGFLAPHDESTRRMANEQAERAKKRHEKMPEVVSDKPALKPRKAVTKAVELAPERWAGLPFIPLVDEPPASKPVWLSFEPGKCSALCAFAGTAKTPTALALGIGIALGVEAIGHATEQRNTLYAAFEGARLARRRAGRIARSYGVELSELQADGRFEIVQAASGTMNSESIELLCELALQNDVGCLIIDTWGSACDGSIDRNSAAFSDGLKQLGDFSDDTGVLVIVLLHLRKDSKGKESVTLQSIDGHNSIAGALQGAIALSRPDAEERNLIELSCLRAPEQEFEPFAIEWKDEAAEGMTSGQMAVLANKGIDPKRYVLRPVLTQAPDKKPQTASEQRQLADTREEHVRRLALVKRFMRRRDLPPVSVREISANWGDVSGTHKAIKATLNQLVIGGVLMVTQGVRTDVYEAEAEGPAFRKALVRMGLDGRTPAG